MLEDDSGRHEEVQDIPKQMSEEDIASVLAKYDQLLGTEGKSPNPDD